MLFLVPGIGRAEDGPPPVRTIWREPAQGCEARPAAAQLAPCRDADVALAPDTIWIAVTDPESSAAQPSPPRIRLFGVPSRTSAEAPARSGTSEFQGSSPRLAFTSAARLILVSLEGSSAAPRLVVRARAAGKWSKPQTMPAQRSRRVLHVGRLSCGPAGLLLPIVSSDRSRKIEVRCIRSTNGGDSWTAGDVVPLADPTAASAEVEQTSDGLAVLLVRTGTSLARSVSHDGGDTWAQCQALGMQVHPGPIALAREGEQLGLAWTEPVDSALAPPGLQALRHARSADAGATWTAQPRLALRPGSVPWALRLATSAREQVLLLATETGSRTALACRLEASPASAPSPEPGRYAFDRGTALEALQVLAEHACRRPHRADRLFVEAYFMRTLVAAHAILGADSSFDRWFDTRAGLQRAIDFADSLVASQRWVGFWNVGYGAIYWADMAAAVALYPALEPYVDAERCARYQASAERFVGALEKQNMFLAGGAIGAGPTLGTDRVQSAIDARRPYLVSTALVGLTTEAWLYHRTQAPEHRRRALAALEYTLSQLAPDGFSEELGRKEGCLRVASYVQEGWMAIDRFLDDPDLTARLRQALAPHVEWILAAQRPDGTWADAAPGSFARTPGIVNFLIWYDQRCTPSSAVCAAVQRASAALIEPDRWAEAGLFHIGPNQEVLRALSGRAVAALAGARPVP